MSIFTDVFVKPPRRSKKVLDHPVLTTTDFGKIIPVLLEDVVPGDVFKCKSAAEIKLFPTLAPLRQGIEVRLDYFFVPNRLLWDDWQTFITGGEDGTDTPVRPFIWLDKTSEVGSLQDYFGLPVKLTRGGTSLRPDDTIPIDAMPFRAYNLIWNEYYRDENLQGEAIVVKDSGLDEETETSLKYRGLKKDYFTSALPWTQRGPQVSIPIAGEAPLIGSTDVSYVNTSDQGDYTRDDEQNFYEGLQQAYMKRDSVVQNHADMAVGSDSQGNSVKVNHSHSVTIPSLELSDGSHADLSEATGVTINELRRLNAVQKWLERNARAGSRYIEQILSHFGVRTPDYRLDRPEYLGGNKQVIGMAEILQTSQTDSTPQGNRAGVGFGNMLAKSRKFHIQEHGWILGLLSIIPANNIYADGVARRWTRESKFDYYFPEFQNLGEQAIVQRELYGYYNETIPWNSTFGYTPRYAEYQYHPGIVTGQMRNSMSYWHMARLFKDSPVLNAQFINSYNSLQDYDRIFPTDESLGDRFVVNMYHFERLKRPMQKNPQPSL